MCSEKNRVFLATLLVCICFITGCGDKGTPSEGPAVNADARTLAENQISPEKLIGRWQRRDGPYVIEIRKTNDDGPLDVAYYNPKPINIAEAKVSQEEAAMKIFIELRDKGYPGSTYTLYYSSKRDMLGGTYFHAGIKQYFQVFFVRMKQ
ncbi:hypothetical protein [Desulfonema magnum]|uniref:Lipoprotein n=1 Tax=Desulfonema magnum TaxID=45655 RepID=A0A975BM79_9BACT|nr:hypothetical protein [Desulfonema magnum]QTA87812.1 Uncharacterized protein dnm_038490 [Desulfonema magnum]